MVSEVIDIVFNPDALDRALNEAELSQAELARLVGFKHRNTLNRIIKKKREATATDLLRFCLVLKKSPEDFALKT